MSEFVKVATIEELAPGECKSVEVSGSRIALFNVAGKFYAMDDTCAHRGGPLGEGSLDGTIVTCPWHGWKYDVSTGACQTNSRTQLTCYEVRVDGDDVTIALG
jgi:nitrite reductase (NADH) small subunit/3-phenylpropionate/trans-cinnamate dioxygenase ferredoxin subunit